MINMGDNETQLLFSEDDTDTQRLQRSSNLAYTSKLSVDNSTQTREGDITISEIGSEKELSYSTRELPYIDYYHNRKILDPRNEDMARIILYELERLPENHRIAAFMAMFNELKKIQSRVSSLPAANPMEDSEKPRPSSLKLKVMENLKRLHGDNE